MTDNTGNISNSLIVGEFTVDKSPPKLIDINSTNKDGFYKIGDNISIQLIFDENLNIDNTAGSPRIKLETGLNDKYAYYKNVDNNILNFNYIVEENDNSSKLNYHSINSFELNSSIITDSLGNRAKFLDMRLPDLSIGGSLKFKKIIVDGIRPEITLTSPTNNESSVKAHSDIRIDFSEPMDVNTITANTTDNNCNGSVQVSQDNFTTCKKFWNPPVVTNDNKTFAFNPYPSLFLGGNYKIKILLSIKDRVGNYLIDNTTVNFDVYKIFLTNSHDASVRSALYIFLNPFS